MEAIFKKTTDCSPEELSQFEKLVRAGRAVTGIGLTDRIRRCRWLAFLPFENYVIACGAIKVPTGTYRKAKFAAAEVLSLADNYFLELGYVSVDSQHSRQGHSKRIVSKLLEAPETDRLFATTRSPWMARSLRQFGFQRLGKNIDNKASPLFLMVRG